MEGKSDRLSKVKDNEAHGHSAAGKSANEAVQAPHHAAAPPVVPNNKIVKAEEKGKPPITKKSNSKCTDHRPHERCLEWKKEGLCKKNDQVKKDCCNTCK